MCCKVCFDDMFPWLENVQRDHVVDLVQALDWNLWCLHCTAGNFWSEILMCTI